MKKSILALAFLVFLFSCGNSDQKASPAAEKPVAKVSKHNEEFNSSFGNLLTAYFQLKDAFVKTDSSLVNKAAAALVLAADSMKWGDLKDSAAILETAQTFVKSISVDAGSMLKESNLEENRKTFSTISENLYPLIQTVKFDKQTVYHQFCPMAFNDVGAYWLSSSSDIENPYFGDKMLTCGEVKDSLNF